MGFLFSSAGKDLRRRLRDPLSLALWAGMPLTIALLLSLAFGRDGASPEAHLLVDDRDGSFLSGLLIGAFGQGQLAELVRVELVDGATGRARLERGDGSALLVIPAGFGDAVLRERPAELQLIKNPAQSVLPAILEELLVTLVDAVFYLQRLLRVPLSSILTAPAPGAATLPDSTVASISVTINDLVERLSPYLLPPAIDLEITAAADTQETRSLPELMFPGMLVLALLFVAQGISEDVWKERSRGTLRRAFTTPQPLWVFLAGKLLAGAAIVAGVALVGLLAARLIFGSRFGNLPLALVWLTLTGTVLLALLILVQLHARSERGGNLLTGIAIFPLAMAGGSFFPFEVMPAWLAAIGRYTPNGWALTQLVAILRNGARLESLAPAVAALLLVGALAFLLSTRRLKTGFTRG